MFTEREEIKKSEKKIKKSFLLTLNRVGAVVLFGLGIILVFVALYFAEDEKSLAKLLISFSEKIGLALIVASVTSFVIISYRKKLESVFEYKSDELDNKYILKEQQRRLLAGIKETGIRQIYSDRGTSDKDYRLHLIEHLRKIPKNGEVKIIGVTLARFFGSNYDKEIVSIFFDLLMRGVKFKLLILDPRSAAAVKRAYTDQYELVESHGYVASTILRDLLIVIRKLYEPTPDWCIDDELRDRIKSQIKVRLYDTNPVCHLIILGKYTFVEQYHNGGGPYLRDILGQHKEYSNMPNYTGFIPVFKINRHSIYGHLMTSHFDNIWNSTFSETADIREKTVYESIFDYNVSEWMKRGLVLENSHNTAPKPLS